MPVLWRRRLRLRGGWVGSRPHRLVQLPPQSPGPSKVCLGVLIDTGQTKTPSGFLGLLLTRIPGNQFRQML